MSSYSKYLESKLRNICASTKLTAANHKKKLIVLAIIIVSGYIAKKTITLAHIIRIVESISKLVQYLPLPEAPKLRQIAPYQVTKHTALKSILEAIRLEELRAKIAKKQASYENLKTSIVVGTMLTLNLYNINSFYFTIQNKYREDFLELQASTQLDEAMYLIRKKFLEEIPIFFEHFRELLFHQTSQIDLMDVYTIKEFQQLFLKLNKTIFSSKINIKTESKPSKIEETNPDSKNRFTTHYQYQEQKKINKISTIFNILGKFASIFSFFNIGDLFKDPKIQLTEERYDLVKQIYILSLKKTQFQYISWPNQKSKELFDLVVEEITYMLLSTNFSILLKGYSEYNTVILINRIQLFLNLKKKQNFKFGQFLPGLYKILQQQFLKSEQQDLRQKFHASQVKKAIRFISQNENVQRVCLQEAQAEGMQQKILKQIETKNNFKHLQKEFQLKYFNERSGMTYRIKPDGQSGKQGKQGKQMQTILKMLSGSQGLTLND